jgi:membrane-bound lytic murein transglycosylase D
VRQKMLSSWNGLPGLVRRPARTLSRPVLSVIIAALIILSGLSGTGAEAQQKKAPAPERRIADADKDLTGLRKEFNPFSLDAIPESMTLCDRKISLYRDDLRERYEREFFQLIEHRGLMTILVKRYFKYLPSINEEIEKAQAPTDLIFLVINESYLNPRALSKANAAGLWQFIQETGKREGLTVNDQIDERYNVKKATQSAMTHLKRLHGEFGDWIIAMAAYNAGSQRLRDALANQNTRDFFDMHLPEETDRYIFRIMAIKEIITNREKYGILVYDRELYKPVRLVEVILELHRETHSNILAKAMDLPYRAFREYNLHLKRYKITAGVYHINVPSDRKEAFLKNLKGHDSIKVIRAAAP